MSLADTMRALFSKVTEVVERRIDEANGDVIEALHGHHCEADCWHNMWVRGQPYVWLPSPEDNKAHAFSIEIRDQPGRKRYYSACSAVYLKQATSAYAPMQCADCLRIVGG